MNAIKGINGIVFKKFDYLDKQSFPGVGERGFIYRHYQTEPKQRNIDFIIVFDERGVQVDFHKRKETYELVTECFGEARTLCTILDLAVLTNPELLVGVFNFSLRKW